MKWFLHGAIGLAMITSAGCASARTPHPQMSQAGCCASPQHYAPAYQAPVYRAYDDGRTDCCETQDPRQARYYQLPVYAEAPEGCCQEDQRVDDRYGPLPSDRGQGRGEFRVHSYGGAEQHYGNCLDRRTGQICDCDDAFDSGYIIERGEYNREGPLAGYGASPMRVNPDFFYETGGVGPIPMGGYGGGGGYAVISGGGGGSSFASSNASASAYSSSNTSINIGGFGGGMGGHGGKGGYGGGMGGHGGYGGKGGHGGQGSHGGMGGGKD